MARRIALAALAVTVVTVLAVTSGGRGGVDPSADPPALELRMELAANLEPFDDCDELLDEFEESAEEIRQSVGVPRLGMGVAEDRALLSEAPEGAAGSGATGGPAEGAAPSEEPSPRLLQMVPGDDDFSVTNVQEEGVDEPDLVKTDGRVVVAVARGRLQVVDLSGPRVLGSAALPEGSHELFLLGDRAVVLTRSWQAVALGGATGGGDVVVEDVIVDGGGGPGAASEYVIGPGSSTTVVSAVDLSDRAHPTVTESATFEGDYVTARLHDGIVRLVLRSSPSGPVPLPLPSGSAEEEERGTTIEQWLPDQIVEPPGGGPATTEPLVPCESVARPPEPSGTGTVTVLTIDPATSMQPVDSDAVMADAQTVYASTDTLYVATNRWFAPTDDLPPDSLTTEMHAFDISDPRETRYLASGRVRGQLLNQWSLSEHEGHLRVATTDGSPWAGVPGGEPTSESFLTVLRRDGDRLSAVGRLGGLGRGEQIHAVRFLGTIGFVVTFRQTDPLYALDLSDPEHPRLLSELKVPGFSAYLHPIGDGRLLGVGQDATEEGSRLGTQVSLFDVSDLSALRRLDQAFIENASSAVENDHKAFLWWGPRRLAVVPIEIYGPPMLVPIEPAPGPGPVPDVAGPPPFLGAAAFRVDGDGVELVGRVSHEGKVGGASPDFYDAPAVLRALVAGGTLYTVSEAGIMASDPGSLAEQGWAPF